MSALRWALLGIFGLGTGGLLGAVGLLAWTFSGMGAIRDGQALGEDATVVRDGYVSLTLLEIGPGEVALVDAGNDPEGAAILAALAERGLGPDAVTAILLTHGHPDHVAACARFPRATAWALDQELPLLRGEVGARGPLTRWFAPKPSGCPNLVGVVDGAEVPLGDRVARIHAVPGHTAGSAAWQVGGLLFLGDSADADADGDLLPAKWLFTDDPTTNRASLVALDRAVGRGATALVFSHTGTADPSALRIWAAARR